MGLEYFKTQVLLLHSEQRTLDQLSSSFSSRYAVHTATSGIEALNTLGATPIDVIISVHDLPGMTGADALREASKRSPETVCILLLGDSTEADSALVDAEQLFRVVRAEPDPELLRELVDNATRKVRLSALSNSANDGAANLDQPVEEHIVMETAESGLSVISDGTGRFRVPDELDFELPPEDMPRNVDILVITRDEEFLATVKEAARGMHHVRHAADVDEATRLNRDNDIGVVLTDAAIVSSEINKLIGTLREGRPRLVNIVAGRRDDGDLMMDLINRGSVYRFLLKPVSPGRARLAVEAAIKHHFDAPDEVFVNSDDDFDFPAGSGLSITQRLVSKEFAGKAARGVGAFGRLLSHVGLIAFNLLKSAARIVLLLVAGGARFFGNLLRAIFLRPKLIAVVLVATGVGVTAWQWERVSPNLMEWLPALQENVPQPSRQATEPTRNGPGYEYLSAARNARQAGQLYTPPGANAVELYSLALANGANDAGVVGEYRDLIEDILDRAEIAVQNRQVDSAGRALEIVEQADSNNPRLTELGLALARIEQTAELEKAQTAISEGRFEDASKFIGNALALLPSETSKVEAVRSELDVALGADRVDHLLGLAAAKLRSGDLVAPNGDNARYYFAQALASDNANESAQQGLLTVAQQLVSKAITEIDDKRLREAHSLLQDAREIAPEVQGLAAAESRLALAWEQLLEMHDDAAPGSNSKPAVAVARESGSVEVLGDKAQATDAGIIPDAISQDTIRIESQASATEPTDATVDSAAVDQEVFDIASLAAPVSSESNAAKNSSRQPVTLSGEMPEVSFGELQAITIIEPRFPRAATRRQVTGWVELRFTVNETGLVEQVYVVDSEQGSMFNQVSIDAVSQWSFEPVMREGAATPVSSVVRLSFELR